MTTNDSAPNVPQSIDPASQIALTVLAKDFDERHEERSSLAEQCRDYDPSMYPEQKAIADTWLNAARITWDLLGGRPGADKYVRRVHTVEMDLRELGKLIAMATASSPANECTNSERTQYELTIAQQQAKIADLQTRIAELTKVPVVDGQTPAQVAKAAFYACVNDEHVNQGMSGFEASTRAVLRVFGNGAAALQQVKNKIAEILHERACDDRPRHPQSILDEAERIIDAELAALTSAKSPTTP